MKRLVPLQCAAWRKLEFKIVLFQNSSANHSKNRATTRRLRTLLCCLPLLATSVAGADEVDCTASSGRNRIALVELYTSEGCNSCPPADRWLGNLSTLGLYPSRVVPLAFHVDYWDYLGWRDRFGQPRFSERQRATSRRNGAKFVYTPQILLNGKDARSLWLSEAFARQIRDINRREADAALSLFPQRHGRNVTIRLSASYSGTDAADVFVALTQNNLESRVGAGENAGKTLQHHFVVRQFWGPLSIARSEALRAVLDAAPLEEDQNSDIVVSAFVQNRTTGDIAQALSTPVCEK